MRTILLAAALATSLAALAQPGPGPGRGPAARWGADVTPGWALMTPEERKEHQQKMATMSSQADCAAYMEKHHQQMEARAKEQGKKLANVGPRPYRACAGLKG